MDCFVANAPLRKRFAFVAGNDALRVMIRISNSGYASAFSRHDFARVLRCPTEKEGAGNAGCALHPRSRVQRCAKENAHEHTGSAEALRHSLRNGFTAYFALSPENRALL